MPFQRERYPAGWKEISRRVREAAGNRCEWCHAPNAELIVRAPGGFWSCEPEKWFNRNGNAVDALSICGRTERGPEGFVMPDCKTWNVRVVLTTAHLGPNKHDKMDCSNLASLCQSCHLKEDADEHRVNASATRARKKAAGILPLFEGVI